MAAWASDGGAEMNAHAALSSLTERERGASGRSSASALIVARRCDSGTLRLPANRPRFSLSGRSSAPSLPAHLICAAFLLPLYAVEMRHFFQKVLALFDDLCYNKSVARLGNADVAQSVERILGKDEVTGSNPVISSTKEPGY